MNPTYISLLSPEFDYGLVAFNPRIPHTTNHPISICRSSGYEPPSPYIDSDLKYITQMLMEENNIEENSTIFHDTLALQVMENSLYRVLSLPFPDGTTAKKNHKREERELCQQQKPNKQLAASAEENELSEMFDKVLLCPMENTEPVCFDKPRANKVPQKTEESSKGLIRNARKQKHKKEIVDLRSLLLLCAQAVSVSDYRTSNQLLKQIRENSLPTGDGSQRLAYYFANGLEARLLGGEDGGQSFYTSASTALNNRYTSTDMLTVYKTYESAFPFRKISVYYTTRMILQAAENAKALHLIDFGILYGFKWPMLIQLLSMRDGGPPKLRITGIELPQSGFRPYETMNATGRLLAKYCKKFNVPFQYNSKVSHNWEAIKFEELGIDYETEVVAVSWQFRSNNLLDETIQVNCPRSKVLNLIKKINPAIFVHSIFNGSYSSPFFMTRFREAMFHFSALFDMFDSCLPRDDQQRKIFEKEFYGKVVMNVLAHEGLERVERPETYKQWHVRTVRAGFKPLPLEQKLLKSFRGELTDLFNKDYMIDHEDSQWLLQGWKGRYFCATSCWVPLPI